MRSVIKRLSTRIQIAAVVLVVMVFSALAFILDMNLRSSLVADYKASLDTHLQLNSLRIQQSSSNLRQDVIFLANTPPVAGIMRAALSRGGNPRDHAAPGNWIGSLEEIFSAFLAAHPDYLGVSFIGLADGVHELARVRQHRNQVPVDAELHEPDQEDAFREALQMHPGEVYLSGLDSPGDSTRRFTRSMHALIPVYAATGKLFGVLQLDLDASTLLEDMTRGLPEHTQASIVAEDGTTVFRSGVNPAYPMTNRTLQPGRLSMHEIESADGQHFVSTIRVHFDPGHPRRSLLLAYSLPASALDLQIGRVRRAFIASGLGLLLLSAAFVWLRLRTLMRPLVQVTRAARSIAAGDRAVSLPAVAHGEVADLANAMRHMLDRIAERERDFQRLNAELEERVRERTAELRLAASVVENTSEGVMVTDAQSRIVAVNPAFTEITGFTAGEAIGSSPRLLRSEHHATAFYQQIWSELTTLGNWSGEIWNRRKNGEAFLERLTINRVPGEEGGADCYVGVFYDITEIRQKDEELHFLAYHDPLTGLPNRILLQDRLHFAIETAKREELCLAVMFLDLDRFKEVNDTLGHDIGDLLLDEVADRLKADLRGVDTVARIGGDEFVVVLQSVGEPRHAAMVAQNLITAVSLPYSIKSCLVEIGVSVGIALFPDHGLDSEELMRHADRAMYDAKAAGRGVLRFFNPAEGLSSAG